MTNSENNYNQVNPEVGQYVHSSQLNNKYENNSKNVSKTKIVNNHIVNPWFFKICIFALSAIGIISMFLPFVSVNIFTFSESITLFKTGESYGDGIIYVVLLLILVVLTAFNKKISSLLTSIITAIGFSITLFNLYSGIGDYSGMLNPELGYYLACFSIYGLVVITLIQAIFSRIEKKANARIANVEVNNGDDALNLNSDDRGDNAESDMEQSFDKPDCCKVCGERPNFGSESEIIDTEVKQYEEENVKSKDNNVLNTEEANATVDNEDIDTINNDKD